ncbi:hypothetical protein GMNKNHGO_00133 [Enterococcus phage vB_Efa29212_3e]|uniref:Uncharacterized protein n=1 Tax=Enterococcus phage vB_Efa29212_3e TaxID=2982224 RepID=A0A978ABV2_9CAUD|nr:hypothetical protein GMNKNHGO_00133 [Enterococcus phage vB_Efa29212_3e]
MNNEVEVPKQVKEFIDKQREQLMDKLQIILEGQRHACEYPKSEFSKWFFANTDTFIQAVANTASLPKYYVVMPQKQKGDYGLLLRKDGKLAVNILPRNEPLSQDTLSKLKDYYLTEAEIKEIDERYWLFKKTREELSYELRNCII